MRLTAALNAEVNTDSMSHISILDTTLRDGVQGEGVVFSVQDKLNVAQRLDDFGVDYIEGGWPGSNTKDIEFFQKARRYRFLHSHLVAFGSTRRANLKAQKDPLIQALLAAETEIIHVVGKGWDFHVDNVLKVSRAENLEMIHDTVSFLKVRVPEVFFAAEHFFDGYKRNPGYALQCLITARDAGASVLVLPDTNGGALPHEIGAIVRVVHARLGMPLAIHAHDDTGCGIANSLAAVQNGATQVQGTINGYGERCGNANLIAVAANLKLKMGIDCLLPNSLSKATALAGYLDTITGLPHKDQQPYVGRNAFVHKSGIHVDGVMKNPESYEHVAPPTVGNSRHFLVSELSGSSTIVSRAREYGIDLVKGGIQTRLILDRLIALEQEGYAFEEADASFELLVRDALPDDKSSGIIIGDNELNIEYTAVVQKTRSRIHFKVYDQDTSHTTEGNDPVATMDRCLREGIGVHCPELERIVLLQCVTRKIELHGQGETVYRTVVEYGDGGITWRTMGVARDMITSWWFALKDGIRYWLLHHPLSGSSAEAIHS